MHNYKHEVKYYECDRMGITHHSNYVRFMEEARVDYLDRLGYGFDKVYGTKGGSNFHFVLGQEF